MSGFNLRFPFVGLGKVRKSARKASLKKRATTPSSNHVNEVEREQNRERNGHDFRKEGKTDLLGVTAPFVVTMMLAGVMLLAGVASNVEG